MKIITNGYELALYLYKNNYEDELRELFEEYFKNIKGWDEDTIEQFFEENTAIEYFKKIYNEKIFEKKELYFRGFKKYRSKKEYDKFIEFCFDYYDRFFEGNPDFLKNTENDYIIEFVVYESINAVLIREDIDDYELDIIKKFLNDKLYKKYFDNLAYDLSFNYEPDLNELENRIAKYKYVIYYRGGKGYVYSIWGYKPSKINLI
jgi:hypothetical protein